MRKQHPLRATKEWLIDNFEDALGYLALLVAIILSVIARLMRPASREEGAAGRFDDASAQTLFQDIAILIAVVMIVVLLLRILGRLRSIKIRLEDPLSSAWTDEVLKSVPRIVRASYRAEIEHTCQQLKNAVLESRVDIRARPLASRFRDGYVAALAELEGCELFATSIATPQYFWGSQSRVEDVRATKSVMDAIEDFVKKGRMHRLFVIGGHAPSEDEMAVLNAQVRAGVHVYTIERNFVDQADQRYFVIDSRGTLFAWEAWVSNGNSEIIRIRATENAGDLADLHAVRKRLFASEHCVSWSPVNKA